MARLFITPREMNFIADITREIIKDVIGQAIHYYPVSELKTLSHPLYKESVRKVYDNPIKIDALVDVVTQKSTNLSEFGIDKQYQVEVFIQQRDMLEKNIEPSIGDFFSFGNVFYEIVEKLLMRNIYGQVEHSDGIKIVGNRAREGQFDALVKGPTDISFLDEDAVQSSFEQQRGYGMNSEGETGDVRDLVKTGVLDAPLTGPKKVNRAGGTEDNSDHASAFYDED